MSGLTIGSSGTGEMTISDSGGVRLGFSGGGSVTVASGSGSVGRLVFGTGVTASALAAVSINGGLGQGTVEFAQSGGYTMSASLGGTLAVNQSGAGRTSLTGSNSFAGPLTITGGTLQVGAGGTAGTLGSGSIVNNSVLAFARTDAYGGPLLRSIGGTGSVQLLSGSLGLTGSNSYAGGTLVAAGSLSLSGTAAIAHPDADFLLGLASGTQATLSMFGGRIDAYAVSFGEAAGSRGIANVSGGVVSGSGVYIGASGTGTVNVSGGVVNGSLAYIGSGTGAFGTLNVTGGTFGGRNMYVGYAAPGTVQLSGGGITVDEFAIGYGSSSSGLATVAGGTLSVGNSMSVGMSGVGGLRVSGSGVVIVANGAGIVTLATGSASAGSLEIGDSGDPGTFTAGLVQAGSGSASVLFRHSSTGYTFATRLDGGPVGSVISGSGSVTLATGALTLTGSSTYTGPTFINGGRLVLDRAGILAASRSISIASGAVLDVSGTGVGGAFQVAAGQTLGGAGAVAGSMTVGAGATIAPGMSPGALTVTENTTWLGGGNYNWQVADAAGLAGSLTGWDLLRVSGSLTISSTAGNPFFINLWTLSGVAPDVSGSATNFNPLRSGTWTIASASGGITGFAADKFAIRTSAINGTGGFANSLAGGLFTLAQSGNDLNLVFTASSASPTVITINVASGTQTQAQAGYATLTGSLPLVKTGAGTLVVNQPNPISGSTSIQGGVLRLADGAALSASRVVPLAGGTLSLTPYLQTTVGGLAASAGGLTNVGSGMVTVAAGLSAADMVSAIVTGMGDGSWNGTSGITSSVAAADVASTVPRTVGWLDNGDGSVSFAFAAPGDTNIDWQVDVLDASNFLSFGKFDTGLPASWQEGDFTYDGVVDVLDAADFFGTGLYDTGSYNPPPAAAGIAAVPEPSTFALLAAAGLTLSAFRRRTQ